MATRSFLILFGSVTGKAQSIAELIHREAEVKGFEARLLCMSQMDQVGLTNSSSIF
jgi:flavodoxin